MSDSKKHKQISDSKSYKDLLEELSVKLKLLKIAQDQINNIPSETLNKDKLEEKAIVINLFNKVFDRNMGTTFSGMVGKSRLKLEIRECDNLISVVNDSIKYLQYEEPDKSIAEEIGLDPKKISESVDELEKYVDELEKPRSIKGKPLTNINISQAIKMLNKYAAMLDEKEYPILGGERVSDKDWFENWTPEGDTEQAVKEIKAEVEAAERTERRKKALETAENALVGVSGPSQSEPVSLWASGVSGVAWLEGVTGVTGPPPRNYRSVPTSLAHPFGVEEIPAVKKTEPTKEYAVGSESSMFRRQGAKLPKPIIHIPRVPGNTTPGFSEIKEEFPEKTYVGNRVSIDDLYNILGVTNVAKEYTDALKTIEDFEEKLIKYTKEYVVAKRNLIIVKAGMKQAYEDLLKSINTEL
jgi:hypothetical protein